MIKEERLDIFLSRKYNFSRNYSKELIEKGLIYVDGKNIFKPSFKVNLNSKVILSELPFKYVSRGGLKLEKALNKFNINIQDKVCLDIGASTGGFTDCMLKNNANKIYAIDVGSNQLHFSLKNNRKVISLENTDIRNIDKTFFVENIKFISIDVSFISITKILDKIYEFLYEDGDCVILIKPQFEVGKKNLNKRGIVKDRKIHKKIIIDILELIKNFNFVICNLDYSPIRGKSGNIEYILHIRKFEEKYTKFDFSSINQVINKGFEYLV